MRDTRVAGRTGVGATTMKLPTRRSVLRSVLGAAGLAVVPGALSACSGSGGSTRLRATWWGDTSLNNAVKKALTSFGQKHKSTVVGESIAFDGYWNKLTTETAGGNPPDLEMQAASYLPEFGSRKALLDLNRYVGKGLDMSTLDPGIRGFGKIGNQLVGVVAATNAEGLLFDVTALRQLGIAPPKDQMAWDALAALANQIHAKQSNLHGLQDAGGDLIVFDVFIRSAGKELFDDQGKVAVTDDDLREWFTFWDQLRKSGGTPPAAMTAQSTAIPTSPMVSGKAVMTFAWTQDFISYKSSMKDDLDVVLTPQRGSSEGLWINAASLWSVSSKTKNPQKAVELVNYLVNDPTAIEQLGAVLGGPPTAKARKQIGPTLKGADKMAVDYMTTVAAHSRPLNRLWPAGFTALRTDFGTINQSVGFGKATVSAAIDAFWKSAKKNDVA